MVRVLWGAGLVACPGIPALHSAPVKGLFIYFFYEPVVKVLVISSSNGLSFRSVTPVVTFTV